MHPADQQDDPLAGATDNAVSVLASALEAYRRTASPYYDEVFDAARTEFDWVGSIGKVHLAALVVWKRLTAATPWAAELMQTRDRAVRAVTAEACGHANSGDDPAEQARKARSSLLTLPDCTSGDALASAIICAANPDNMAVYDSRAHTALSRLGIQLSNAPRRYERYVAIVTSVRERAKADGRSWTARDVDLALYTLGK